MTAHASIFRSAWVSLVQLVCVCLGLRRSVVVCIGLYVFVTYVLVLVYDKAPACSAELNPLPKAVTSPSSMMHLVNIELAVGGASWCMQSPTFLCRTTIARCPHPATAFDE